MKKNAGKRGEAAILAIALAVAGALSLLNEMLPLWGSQLSWPAVLHASPYLLVAVGISLVMAEEQAQPVISSSSSSSRRKEEGRYGR